MVPQKVKLKIDHIKGSKSTQFIIVSFQEMFTESLHQRTHAAHKRVDTHPFVAHIRTSKLAGDMYIELNKACVCEIQNAITSSQVNSPIFDFIQQNLLREHCDVSAQQLVCAEYNVLLKRCSTYPLEHAYMFYLGLLYGGQMLSKMLPEHAEFLHFANKQDLIKQFKLLLNDNVSESMEPDFIDRVNNSYRLINNIFDHFLSRVVDCQQNQA